MKTILIIDDDEILRETLADIFMEFKYYVVEANNDIDGLEKVKINCPDLIICDLDMQRLAGYCFILELQKSNFSKIPVLFLCSDYELKVKGVLGSAKNFLTKPFKVHDLKKTINYCLNF
jgi:two-component system, chemotaxis family, chemotaxis protein CheY